MSKNQLVKQQSGLISVTVTIVIMILVTLIVSSFALVVRREQSRTLNNQLNTQALSAAEAGIKDAQSAIYAGNIDGDITECSGNTSFIGKMQTKGIDFNKDVSDNVQYSCVLINQHTLPDFQKDASVQDGTLVVPIDAESNIDNLRISWEGSGTADNYSSVPSDFKLPKSLDAPILRVVLFKASATLPATTFTREDMKNSAQTMFLYPKSGGGSSSGIVLYDTTPPVSSETRPNQGAFVSGECNSSNKNMSINSKPAVYGCNVDITGLNGQKYFLIVRPLYKNASFNVATFNGTNPVKLLDAQAEIDATGKAADVLKRIRVRIPTKTTLYYQDIYGNGGLIPDSVISTTKTLCKMWKVGAATADSECSSPPTTPPPPGGGNGDSGFDQDTCATNPDPGCNNGIYQGEAFDSEQDPRRTERYVTNSSTNSPSFVAGCVWNWGDGTSTSGVACNSGQTTTHEYPRTPAGSWWTVCRYYRATLTINFNNGYPPMSYSEDLEVPIKSSVPGHSNPC